MGLEKKNFNWKCFTTEFCEWALQFSRARGPGKNCIESTNDNCFQMMDLPTTKTSVKMPFSHSTEKFQILQI